MRNIMVIMYVRILRIRLNQGIQDQSKFSGRNCNFFKGISTKDAVITHWPDFHWNVSKSWLQRMDFFENYAILSIQIDNANCYMYMSNKKGDIRLWFEEEKFSPGGASVQKTAEIFFKYK